MSLRYEDLPPALRRRVDAETPTAPRERRSGSGAASGALGRGPMVCHACGFPVLWPAKDGTPKAAKDHQAETGHARWDLPL